MLSIFVDSAVYIALTVDYAQTWFHLTGLERWGLAVVLIAIFAYVNIRGLQLASWIFVVLQVIVFVPFMALAVLGFAHWHYDPFHPILLPGVSLVGGVGVALSVGIWMYSGFESLSTMAGEIKSPQRVIPRAVMFTLPVVLVFYVLSTMGGMAAVGHWADWARAPSTTSWAWDSWSAARRCGTCSSPPCWPVTSPCSSPFWRPAHDPRMCSPKTS